MNSERRYRRIDGRAPICRERVFNQLVMGKGGKFEVGSTVQTCTKGIKLLVMFLTNGRRLFVSGYGGIRIHRSISRIRHKVVLLAISFF